MKSSLIEEQNAIIQSRNYAAARVLQQKWALLRQQTPLPDPIKTVAAADVAFTNAKTHAIAGIIVYSYPDLIEIERKSAKLPLIFPYVPGLLSFREVPVILAAAEKLQTIPDILLVDGQGIAHPRRFGLACHLGVLLDWPTIGCAKSRLLGTHQPLGPQKGASQPLFDKDEQIGAVLRTRDNVKCLYISEGNRVNLDQALPFVLSCTTKYRLTEPIRHADHYVTQLRSAII